MLLIKTVRGKKYKDYYIKIHLPENIAEKIDYYIAEIDEETGTIIKPVIRE